MIVISAYACEPDKGSEPGVGWHWAEEISRRHEVLIITRKNNRVSIEKELKRTGNKNIDVIYYDPPKWLTFWKRGSRGVQLFYYIWQYGAYLKVKKYVPLKDVEAVFAVTFGNLWKPTFMYKLGVPMIWGPVGGGEEVPKQLLDHLSKKQKFVEFLRRVSKKIPLSNPWLGTICNHANLIVARTYDSLACIDQKYHSKCRIMIETGVDEVEFKEFSGMGKEPSQSKKFTYVGRLVSLKMVDIGINAFAGVVKKYPDAVLNIVGDGPMEDQLKKLSLELHIEDNVFFHGSKPRREAMKILSDSRALLMTSCKEGGAWVLFEAMMCGRPVLCMDTAGMKVVVDNSCGIKIPMGSYNEMVCRFEQAMLQLIEKPDQADALGQGGRELVTQRYLWSKKGEEFEKWLSII